jgi:hypothetical protein
MKLDLDILYAFVLCILIAVFTIQSREIRILQTEIKELRIIVDQKFLPPVNTDKNL